MQGLGIIFTLAWRNLWRNHRRTIIMLAAISIGAWAMIFMTSLMRGMVNDMLRDGISALPGHVQVHHPDYRDDPSVNNLVARTSSEISASLAAAGIDRFAARVRVPAIISSERESRGVTLLGVEPAEERSIAAVGTAIAEGRALDSAADTGIVIGRELADKLETEVGKRVVIMSQDPDNDVADRGYRVVGLFEANLAAQEEMFVFAGRTTVQKMLRIDDRVSVVAILGDDYRVVEPILETVRATIDDQDEILPWT
mgnify:FL=1